VPLSKRHWAASSARIRPEIRESNSTNRIGYSTCFSKSPAPSRRSSVRANVLRSTSKITTVGHPNINTHSLSSAGQAVSTALQAVSRRTPAGPAAQPSASSLGTNDACGLPGRCSSQSAQTAIQGTRISVSSSLLVGYDEPKVLRSSSR